MGHRVVVPVPLGTPVFELAVPCEVFGVDRSDVVADWYDFRLCPVGPAPVALPHGLVLTGGGTLDDVAAAGLLDGRRATTHWRHAGLLARLYPRVAVEADSIYVRDRGVLTSAGVSAGIDLALAMVEEDCGADLAREVARDLVVFLQRPGGQSQFSVAARTPRPRHDPLREVLDAVAADPAADHSLPVMAARAGVSVRHLTRLFHEQVGETPGAYVEALRVEAAQAALDAGESVTGAAARAGFGSDESLRRAFLRRLGVTPSAYRSRFRTAFS